MILNIINELEKFILMNVKKYILNLYLLIKIFFKFNKIIY